MKHLIEKKTAILISLIALTAAGCSESTSSARSIASVASAPVALDTIDIEATPPSTPAEPAVAAAESAPQAAEVAASSSVSASSEPAEAAASATPPTLELTRLTMARGVESYEPVDAAERFTADGRLLYAYMQIINRGTEDQNIVISYEREDGLFVGPVQLTVPPSTRGYRTFTRTGWVRNPGLWTVSVRTTDGDLLGQAEFTIDS